MHGEFDFSDTDKPDLKLGNLWMWVKNYSFEPGETGEPEGDFMADIAVYTENEGVSISEDCSFIYLDRLIKFGKELDLMAGGNKLEARLVGFDMESCKERISLTVRSTGKKETARYYMDIEIVRDLCSEEYSMRFDLKREELVAAAEACGKILEKFPLEREYTKDVYFTPYVRDDRFSYKLKGIPPIPINTAAREACVSLADSPEGDYRSLFLFGPTGCGKTRLLKTTAGRLVQKNKDLKTVYVSAKTFSDELILSIRARQEERFRGHYNGADFMIIENVQHLADRKEAQQALLHTLEELERNGKRVIFSCDRPPDKLEGVGERLKSRFAGDAVVGFEPLQKDEKKALILAIAGEIKMVLPEEVADLLAENSGSDIHKIEGLLTSLRFSMKKQDTPIPLELAKEIVKEEAYFLKPILIKREEAEKMMEELQALREENRKLKAKLEGCPKSER